jgi:hypothetical protein
MTVEIWIVLTLASALLVGFLMSATDDIGAGVFGFVWGFMFTCSLSVFAAIIYVAYHFISKYW